MVLLEEVRSLLGQLGSTRMDLSAYDTAWVAAVSTTGGAPRFPQSLHWLRRHQHADGSWGAGGGCGQTHPYYHDRLLTTLRAVLTLDTWSESLCDRRQVEGGLAYIRAHAGDLAKDPVETVAFELLFPTLLDEAAQRGLDVPQEAFVPVRVMGAAKRARAPRHLAYDRRTPLVISLEALGPHFEVELASAVQEVNGSVGTSPSATAYLLQHCPDNDAAAGYLSQILQGDSAAGGVPAFFPIETYEYSWALYQLGQAQPDIHRQMAATITPMLDYLYTTRTRTGWTFCAQTAVKESDTTAVCFAVLSQAGYTLNPDLLYQYEEADHFRVYPFERNPSPSANAHILDALHYCDPHERAPRVEKVIRFLGETRQPGGFWFDKWHVSPYYTTSHVVLAAQDWAPNLVAPAIDWFLAGQRPDGSWGYYTATIEETAYAVLALLAWQRTGHCVPRDVIARGVAYLYEHYTADEAAYPPLWIAKTLHVPLLIAQAGVLAALLAAEAQG
jgi:halimadienyl-diphosphate synthase